MQTQLTQQNTFQLVRATNMWSGAEGWDLLFYYNVYRIGLAILLVALASPNFDVLTVGYDSWTLIFAISGFTILSIASFIGIRYNSPAIHIQAHVQFMLDILLISVLTLSHELHQSNIIVFYITTVAATAVMFRTKTALAYATIVTIVIYFRDVLGYIEGKAALNEFYFTALTALGLFSIVLVVSRIAKRTRVVQDVLEQQELELADLDDINQIIIDQLEIGVLFIENDLSIKLINNSARELIGEHIKGSKVIGNFADLLRIYVDMPSGKHFSFSGRNKVLGLNSTLMRSGVMIRIEDKTTQSREIQQSKLSTVGRFASAISHEIRNPLNAINHAAQLMQPELQNPENEELIGIIRKHVKRINNIIESILDRSRPGQVNQQQLEMTAWLATFIETFEQSLGGETAFIEQSGNSITVNFDPTQLEQILTNLCQNSLKYGRTAITNLKINLVTGMDQNKVPYLDIMNNGNPIDDNIVDKLFEPFYSSDSKSSGLGLYISREFCSLNGANIEYFKDTNQHGFRIEFS